MHMAFCNVSPPDLTSFSSEFRNALTTMGERSLKAELDDLLATQDSLMLASLPSIDVIPTPRSKLLGVAHGFAVVAHNLTGSPAATDFPSEWPYDVNDVNAISVIQLPGAGRLDKSPFGPNAKIVNGMWTWRWKLQESLRVLRAESTASICIEDNLMAIACRRASDIALAFFPILPHMEDGPDGKWPEYDSGLPLHPLAWDPTRSLFPYDLSWTALPTFIIKVAQDSTIGVLVNVRVAPMEDDVLPPILTLYFEVFDWKSGLLKGVRCLESRTGTYLADLSRVWLQVWDFESWTSTSWSTTISSWSPIPPSQGTMKVPCAWRCGVLRPQTSKCIASRQETRYSSS